MKKNHIIKPKKGKYRIKDIIRTVLLNNDWSMGYKILNDINFLEGNLEDWKNLCRILNIEEKEINKIKTIKMAKHIIAKRLSEITIIPLEVIKSKMKLSSLGKYSEKDKKKLLEKCREYKKRKRK